MGPPEQLYLTLGEIRPSLLTISDWVETVKGHHVSCLKPSVARGPSYEGHGPLVSTVSGDITVTVSGQRYSSWAAAGLFLS